jgi:hypothetical protein
LPWTESRSREDWLAEVRRRGERIRRRRRVTIAIVAAFAVVLPLSTVAGYLVGPPDRSVELSVAGPPAGEVSRPPTTSAVDGLVTGGLPATTDEIAGPAAGAPSQITTTTEVHRPLASADDRAADPTPPTTVRSTDSPVIARADPAQPPTSSSGTGSAGGVGVASSGSRGPGALASTTRRACAAADVKLSLTTDKAIYAMGETVSGSLSVEKTSESDCLLERVDSEGFVYTASAIRFQNAAGRVVGSIINSSHSLSGVPAEPKKAYTQPFSWDQQDCGSDGSTCLQVPAGSYTVVGEWTEIGPFSGRASFGIER